MLTFVIWIRASAHVLIIHYVVHQFSCCMTLLTLAQLSSLWESLYTKWSAGYIWSLTLVCLSKHELTHTCWTFCTNCLMKSYNFPQDFMTFPHCVMFLFQNDSKHLSLFVRVLILWKCPSMNMWTKTNYTFDAYPAVIQLCIFFVVFLLNNMHKLVV